GHAAWGEERIRAATTTLSLYPDFAFAHFQMAMVHVARGHLQQAETVLRQGAAVQDRQVARGDRYPALGLHWLLGLGRLAHDVAEACAEIAREEQRADPHRLYGREYEMSARHCRGVCQLRVGRHREAIASFEAALELYPEHAQSHLGLMLALRAIGSVARAGAVSKALESILSRLGDARPVEASLVGSQLMAIEGQPDEAGEVLCTLLDTAPPGFAGWSIPIEPFLAQLHGSKAFTIVLRRLADRAR